MTRTTITVGMGVLAIVTAGVVLLRTAYAILAPAASSGPVDESRLMARVRSAEATAPDIALQLAREGNLRFPGSPDAAERAAVVVRCLAQLGRVSEARGEAEIMVNQYAGTPWALEVERHTGAHPRVNR